MKKRILIIVLSVMVLIAVGVLICFLATKGRIYTADGLTQNDRCYISFAYVSHDTVCYTVVNDTCRSVGIGDKPTVEKKINGEWQYFSMWRSKTAIAHVLEPFSRTQKRFEIDTWIEDPVGEYRLHFGGEYNIVGYFEITEAMREHVTDHRIYRADGLLQTELVRLEETRFERDEVCFTAVNLLDRKMEFSGTALIQKKEGEGWTDVCARQSKSFEVAGNGKSDRKVTLETLTAGEYRCIYVVERSLADWMPQTDSETGEKTYPLCEQQVYAVGYFTVS